MYATGYVPHFRRRKSIAHNVYIIFEETDLNDLLI